MKVIIWIDPNVEGNENTCYYNELNQNIDYKILKAETVEEGINHINKIKFEETIIIVSGKIFKEFTDAFKKNINNLCFMPNIIIFTANPNLFYSKLDSNFIHNYIGNKFYNSGNVQTDFNKVLEFIKNPKKDKQTLLPRDNEELFNFDYIDTEEKLALPLFYKYLIDFTEEDNHSFIIFLQEKYYAKSKVIRDFIDSIVSLPELPIELLAKYYLRIYTDEESHFYRDLNNDLRKSKRDNYLTYIKVLYKGVQLKSLPLAAKRELYRGCGLPKKEIEKFKKYKNKPKINGLPGPIVFSKTFLSFSKNRNVAERFADMASSNLNKTLFILEKDDEIDYSLSTHADIEGISTIEEESEVLFFPFSSFEINDFNYDEKNNRYEIKLLHLGKHLKKIEADKEIIQMEYEIPKTDFRDEFVKSGLVEEKNVVNNNTKEIYQKFKINENNINKIANPIFLETSTTHISPNPPDKPNFQDTSLLSNPETFRDYKKPYIFRRFIKPEDEENIYKPQITFQDSDQSKVITNDHKIENYIIGQFQIFENDVNKNIRIINSFEQMKRKYDYIKLGDERKYANEREIMDKCTIKINNQEFKNIYFLNFQKAGKYTIVYYFSSYLTRTDFLFAECHNLIDLDLLNFKSKYVTNMACMFLECINLKNINISNIDTKNVEDMNCMFNGCSSLVNLDLSFFMTHNVINMSRLFFGCKSLSRVNLSGFNTQKVTNMHEMF